MARKEKKKKGMSFKSQFFFMVFLWEPLRRTAFSSLCIYQ